MEAIQALMARTAVHLGITEQPSVHSILQIPSSH